MKSDVEAYRIAATGIYLLLKPEYEKADIMWRAGQTFDTVIDYFDEIDTSDAESFIKIVFDRYGKTAGFWYDDFGWWAVSALKASQRPYVRGTTKDGFDSIAADCWNFMTYATGIEGVECSATIHPKGAPNVFEIWRGTETGDKMFAQLKPRVAGGVWNRDWYWPPYGGYNSCNCVPYEPYAMDALGGFQNTVTNALYLILASRLSQARPAAQIYRNAADREMAFLAAWFSMASRDERLLAAVGDSGVYVRERVGYYANGDQVYQYRPPLAWAGDQGLILAGLLDYAGLPKTDQSLIDTASKLLEGSRAYLTGPDGILRNWYDWKNASAPGGDTGNYMTGSGVYMRYVLYAYRTNDTLKAQIASPDFRQFLKTNADACLTPPELDAGDPNGNVTILTNYLATLVAAAVVLAE